MSGIKRWKVCAIALVSASLVFAGCSDDGDGGNNGNNGDPITDTGSDASEDAAADDVGEDAADDAGEDAASDAGADAASDAGADAANDADPDATGDADPDATTSAVVPVTCDSVVPNHVVGMQDSAYDPATLTVSAGEVVQWTNNEPFPITHTVTSGRSDDADRGELFDSGDILQNESYCLRFDEVGSFQYFCKVHPVDMNDGEIVVQ